MADQVKKMTYDYNSGRAFTALLRSPDGTAHYGHISIVFDRDWKNRTAEQQKEMWELFKSFSGRVFTIYEVEERRSDQRSVRFQSKELAEVRKALISKIKERTPNFVFDASRDRSIEHFHSELNPDVALHIGIAPAAIYVNPPPPPVFTFIPGCGFKTKECHPTMNDYDV